MTVPAPMSRPEPVPRPPSAASLPGGVAALLRYR